MLHNTLPLEPRESTYIRNSFELYYEVLVIFGEA